jgi:segregation and condensation protein B
MSEGLEQNLIENPQPKPNDVAATDIPADVARMAEELLSSDSSTASNGSAETSSSGDTPVVSAPSDPPQTIAENPPVPCTSDDNPLPSFSETDTTLESVVEAVLFASDESLSAERLTGIAEVGSVKQIRECIETLNTRYEQSGSSFRIEQIAGGYQMMTLPKYNPWLKKLLRNRADSKFSPAALETLAIIAYKQPIIRADIEAIRGVAAGEVLRSLMYKGLVKIVGRAEVIGRPMLYGTTRKFLEIFGLNSIKDLPKAEDLKNPQQ